METLSIRLATPQDLDPLDALFARAYPRLLRPYYPPSVMVLALPLISRAQPALLASGSYFLAERDGKILAAGGWSQRAPSVHGGQRGRGHVRHVVTDPDHVRQGIGRRLMQHVMLHAKASGMAELACQSTRMAVPFYQSLGFAPLGEIDVPLAHGILFPATQMQAWL